MEAGSLTCLLSLDISSAFDVLVHSALLKRAEHIFGISGSVLSRISSFLFDRKFFVSLGDGRGPCSVISRSYCGVPQGSTLGPILFALFVAPLEQVVLQNGALCHQYADDTHQRKGALVISQSVLTRLSNGFFPII